MNKLEAVHAVQGVHEETEPPRALPSDQLARLLLSVHSVLARETGDSPRERDTVHLSTRHAAACGVYVNKGGGYKRLTRTRISQVGHAVTLRSERSHDARAVQSAW
jgi:hypothetical protein